MAVILKRKCSSVLLAATATVLVSASAAPRPSVDPLRFFEGRTESTGWIKVMFKKPARTHSVGRGRIDSDGTLVLVQQVADEGKPIFERRWRIRQDGPGRFSGSMSQATSRVAIQEVGGRYRFRFKISGNMAVEQWIEPSPNGTSARTTTTIRKLGMKVAAGEAIIRKSAAN